MFLALDESEAYTKRVFGAIVLPKNKLSELEKDFAELRLKHKLFAEIKWTNIDQYYKKYFEFIDLLFKEKSITFHSISFRKKDKKYKAAYILIRSISWKLINEGIKDSVFILFDEDGGMGKAETKETERLLNIDKEFKLKIDFCNQGTSHILGALQLADIITGATASSINNAATSTEKAATIKYIEKKNGIALGWSGATFPKLYDYKIHHFDPISNP